MGAVIFIFLRSQISTSSSFTNSHTDLNMVLHQIGDDLLLVFIEDLVQNGPSLTVFLQQEQAAVPVLRGGGSTAVL